MVTNVEKLVAPVQELNVLTIKNIEKLAELQLKTIEENTNIGLESLKAAIGVKDLDGWKDYLTAQTEVANGIAEGMVANVSTVAELGQDYINEAKGIVEGALTAK